MFSQYKIQITILIDDMTSYCTDIVHAESTNLNF